jgi:hypothetical protein
MPPDVAGSGIGADAAQEIGERFRVARGAKEALNAGSGKGGKEILQVHLQDDPPAHVGRRETLDRPAFDKSPHVRTKFGRDDPVSAEMAGLTHSGPPKFGGAAHLPDFHPQPLHLFLEDCDRTFVVRVGPFAALCQFAKLVQQPVARGVERSQSIPE